MAKKAQYLLQLFGGARNAALAIRGAHQDFLKWHGAVVLSGHDDRRTE